MSNKELFPELDGEKKDHENTGKELADITGALDSLKQKVVVDHNNEQIDIEHELNEVKKDILLQHIGKQEYIPQHHTENLDIPNQQRGVAANNVASFGNTIPRIKNMFGDLNNI